MILNCTAYYTTSFSFDTLWKTVLSWCILYFSIFLLIWPNFFWRQISEELLLTDAWEDFPNQSMGLTEIEGVNEKEELHITDVSSCKNMKL